MAVASVQKASCTFRPTELDGSRTASARSHLASANQRHSTLSGRSAGDATHELAQTRQASCAATDTSEQAGWMLQPDQIMLLIVAATSHDAAPIPALHDSVSAAMPLSPDNMASSSSTSNADACSGDLCRHVADDMPPGPDDGSRPSSASQHNVGSVQDSYASSTTLGSSSANGYSSRCTSANSSKCTSANSSLSGSPHRSMQPLPAVRKVRVCMHEC